MTPLLEVNNLETRFKTPDGEVAAVNGVSFSINPGETVGVVGESGSGKSQMIMSILGLLARNGTMTGSVRFRDQELVGASARDLNRIRGRSIGTVFQDPMTSLNPTLTIGRQLTEMLVVHRNVKGKDARFAAIDALGTVGLPDPAERMRMYPHQLSGGMRQRVMIAVALIADPELLIADEPTTALDVTVQAQILGLLRSVARDRDRSVILVSHDFGVVAGLADRLLVMYAGTIVEQGPAVDLFRAPRHPYTQALLACTPRLDITLDRLPSIPGQPPDMRRLPMGCAFQPRCDDAMARCLLSAPGNFPAGPGRRSACFLEQEKPELNGGPGP
ncbi:MAG: ABC transporter ATP-binding protein [Rhodospirillales bacterium]|nr:ABC transporter ATP-binding protein [Rhodospirillales bacterium]